MEDKFFIPENTDFNIVSLTNSVQIETKQIENFQVDDNVAFKNMMQKSIREHEIFSVLLNEMKPIDFELEAYGERVLQLRNQISDNSKITESLNNKLEKLSLNILQKNVIIIQQLLSMSQEKGFGLGVSDEKFYFYNERCWEHKDNETLLSFLSDFAVKAGLDTLDARQFKVKELLFRQFQSDSIIPNFNDAVKGNMIPLQNGVVFFKNGEIELKPFKKEYFFKYILPFEYDPEAKAPIFENALNRILPDKILQDVLFEVFGSVFTKELNPEKMLILHGCGSNGKSLIHNIINAVFGKENVTNHSLQSLCDPNSKVRASIENTLINFSSEIGNGKFDIDTFKQLISNEPVYAKRLYHDPHRITNYGRFVFNGNTLPSFVENTDAFYRRFIIIPFNVIITDEEKDPYLAKKIIRTELPGVFNLILEGMKRLLAQQGFSKSEIVEVEVKKYRRESSSILSFLDDENFIKSTKHTMHVEVFHQQYKDYCSRNGFSAFSIKKFNAQLRNIGYEVKRSTNGYYHINCEKSIPGFDDSTIILNRY